MKKAINGVLNFFLWVFFAITSLILVLFAILLRIVTAPFDPNRKILQQYSCFWASLYIWFNPFWSATITGLNNVDRKKTYVMVSNHQSMADILVVFRTFLHFKWVSKKSLFKVPFVGWNMWLNGYVGIERGDSESREQCFAECRKWLAKGSSIFFFPEGTRSADGVMKPFKTGAFRLAIETGTDILPMVIRGSQNAIPKHSLMLSGKSHMQLEVLDPISVQGFNKAQLDEESKRLAGIVFEKIREKLG